jgi:hypothetical protein
VEIVGVFPVGQERPASADGALEHERHALSEENRLGTVQAKIGEAVVATDAADGVESSADDVGARTRDGLDSSRSILEKVIGLRARVPELERGTLVEWRCKDSRTGEEAGHDDVLMREEGRLLLRVRGVAH